MPGQVVIVEAQGLPVIPADADFAVVVIGHTTLNPLGAGPGPVSPQYSSPAALAAQWGLGDAVDCACQAIAVTQGNPAPPPVAIYQTPATTPGVRGSSLDTSGVTGDAVVTKTAGTEPVGTYQPRGRVVTGGIVGTAGIVIELSPDDGRTWLPSQALGTALTLEMLIGGLATGVQYDFSLAPIEGTADVTAGALYGGGGSLHGKTLKLSINGGGVITFTGDGGTNTANQAPFFAALEATFPGLDFSVNATHLVITNTSGGSLVIDPTSTMLADLGLTAGTYQASLVAGDLWIESKTTPPIWGASDLFAAGPPATGAFASIAESSIAFAIVVISEPVTAGNFATLSAALNYLLSFGKRVALLCRFRDPNTGETDAQYIAAFQAFRAANHDNRIAVVAGSGWLTDAFRGYRYFRSGLPALLARLQSFAVVPGRLGERVAQHPGFVARGPLEGFTLVDDSGNPIAQAHDELVTGGIDGPVGGAGGGITFYHQRLAELRGTYVSEAPVAYPPSSAILTWMDRRVANGIETAANAIAWTEIQGADIYDPATFALDEDIRAGIQAKIARAIQDRYSAEFQNAADPNLVSVNPTVVVTGSQVAIAVTVRWRPYGYTHDVTITFAVTR